MMVWLNAWFMCSVTSGGGSWMFTSASSVIRTVRLSPQQTPAFFTVGGSEGSGQAVQPLACSTASVRGRSGVGQLGYLV
jgi:hypothetical protein